MVLFRFLSLKVWNGHANPKQVTGERRSLPRAVILHGVGQKTLSFPVQNLRMPAG